ncbi:MAG: 50S ribosomal protein L18 [Thermodesulfobacteriota bacterium]
MSKVEVKREKHLRRKKRVRTKIYGTEERPRLSVFRSARHMYAQIVLDDKGSTVCSASTLDKEAQEAGKFESKVQAAKFIGTLVAKRAKEKGITKVTFDRNGFLYHGRIKAVAEGAREAGLEF